MTEVGTATHLEGMRLWKSPSGKLYVSVATLGQGLNYPINPRPDTRVVKVCQECGRVQS